MPLLQIDVEGLAGTPGASQEIRGEAELGGLRSPLGWVDEGEPVRLALLAEAVAEGVAVSGRVVCRVHLACSRCLVEYVESLEQDVDEIFYFEGAESKSGYSIGGHVIDLEPMVRDAIMLSIPTHPVHATGCRGLCPVCGVDLNLTDCGHDARIPDLRWAPLQALAEKMQEKGA